MAEPVSGSTPAQTGDTGTWAQPPATPAAPHLAGAAHRHLPSCRPEGPPHPHPPFTSMNFMPAAWGSARCNTRDTLCMLAAASVPRSAADTCGDEKRGRATDGRACLLRLHCAGPKDWPKGNTCYPTVRSCNHLLNASTPPLGKRHAPRGSAAPPAAGAAPWPGGCDTTADPAAWRSCEPLPPAAGGGGGGRSLKRLSTCLLLRCRAETPALSCLVQACAACCSAPVSARCTITAPTHIVMVGVQQENRLGVRSCHRLQVLMGWGVG